MINLLPDVDRITICEWAVDELWSGYHDSNKALNYLRTKRGLSDEVIKKFSLGYVPEEARHDLSGRIIMPLYDHHDRLVALTTRDYREDSKFPHWHESFNKDMYLYGLNLAKKNIFGSNKSLVVEGQFDCQALHDHGINISVGALGGVFSYKHVCLLRRYCTDYYIWFDPDDAGHKSWLRCITMYEEKMLDSFGINFIPIILDSDDDPDDYVQKRGKGAVIELMKKSKENAKGKKYAPTC